MNMKVVRVLAAVLVVGAAVPGCTSNSSTREQGASDGAPPELRKGVKVNFSQTATINNSDVWGDPTVKVPDGWVGEVEEVRGHWVRVKVRLSEFGKKNFEARGLKDTIKEEDSRWVNFNTVGQYRIVGEK